MTLPSLTKEEISAFPPIDCQQGLTAQEVEERVKGHLTNKTKKAVSKSYGKILFDNFCNPFNLLLIVITIVMIWGKLSFTHFLFAFILGINIAIGLYQDIHARHLIEKLKVLSDDRCRVLRDGVEVEVTKDAIVKDDIVLLKQGDQIPADAIVRTGHCSCDESLLTGESVAAKKTPGDPLLSGTYIRSGSCVAQIIHVGADSYAEKLQKNASAFSRPKSEIAQSVWNITVSCALIALVFGIAYTLVCFAQNQVSWDGLFPMTDQGGEFIEGLSGSMVAMLPTGMFLLTSVALTTGVVVLAKKNVLVQELYCIEALARVDVLCFDKTGTLTDGAMSVHEAIPFHGFSASRLGYGVNAILAATGDDNATAKALKARFGGRHKGDVRAVIPFDSENKYSAVSLFDDGTYALGAYGFLPAKKCLEAELLMKSYEAKGYRCLVLAYSENLISNGVLPRNLEICGVFVFQDHIKEDAKDNVAWFQDSGVEVYRY